MDAARSLLDDIRQVAGDPASRAQVLSMAQRLKMWIGLHFVEGTKGKKRRVRRLAGGVLAFGEMPVPNEHQDPQGHPTKGGRVGIKHRSIAGVCEDAQDGASSKRASGSNLLLPEARVRECCPQEVVSFTKDSRGDWI
jgi:hypothetical protein